MNYVLTKENVRRSIKIFDLQHNELYKALVIAEEALTNFYGCEADDSPVMKHIRNTLKNAGAE